MAVQGCSSPFIFFKFQWVFCCPWTMLRRFQFYHNTKHCFHSRAEIKSGNRSNKQKNCIPNYLRTKITADTRTLLHRSYTDHTISYNTELKGMWKQLRSWAVTRDWGHIWVVTFLSVCIEVVLVPSGLSPVSGLYQISSQAQSLQGLVSYHNEYRCGQGRNDAGWQPLGHPPDTLLYQQLLECLGDRRSSLHLEQEVGR